MNDWFWQQIYGAWSLPEQAGAQLVHGLLPTARPGEWTEGELARDGALGKVVSGVLWLFAFRMARRLI